ncbi:hypothetical protein B9G55_17020 [Saccharibacillus sp. O16]|nr:hypothetical protein B9G55_17020 [Saccharibacillus sp. O16]
MEQKRYYRSDQVGEWLKKAYTGDQDARHLIENLEGIHILSPDGSVLLHVQVKDALRRPDGSIRILNKAPEPLGIGYPCMDIHHIMDGGSSWTHIPVPLDFPLQQILFLDKEDGGRSMRFALESQDGRRVEASLMQMGRAFRDLDLIMQGAQDTEIEKAFYSMSDLVVPPPPIKRTKADNPPIELQGQGQLEFEELLQWFKGSIHVGERKIRVALNTADRDEALELLPTLFELADALEETDASACRYAAEELLELKNDVWLDEEEEELSEEEFMSRMELESVTLEVEGRAAFWYADGDLFGGHTICVERNADRQFVSADLMG